jgi:hypothetical protein
MPRINDCICCRYYAWDCHLVCALHPSGPDGKTCSDYQFDAEQTGRKFLDFLGLGEPVEINDAVNNPWSEEPADNWSPPGTKYINGELVLIQELMEVTSAYII